MDSKNKTSEKVGPTGPLPPFPGRPFPQIELKSIADLAKIILFLLTTSVTTYASRAILAALDLSKIAKETPAVDTWLLGVTNLQAVAWHGAKIGLLIGIISTVQGLVTLFTYPQLFGYFGPVFTAAFQAPIGLILQFKRAWTAKPPADGQKPNGGEGPGDDDKQGPENTKPKTN